MDIEDDEILREIMEQEERENKQNKELKTTNQASAFKSQQQQQKQNSDSSQLKITKDHFRNYYENFFPFKTFFKWLGKQKTEIFERREISYTLENDIYIRFLCYNSDEDFKKDLLKASPIKIDIGAVYNTLPRYHKTVDPNAFFPVQKELIFDIDMTDYDFVRTCCSEAKICGKCWKYMIVAYEIINAILVEDFGFEHVMWIFSGRRGVHCWISDERAKSLLNDGRSAIATFIKMKIATATGLVYRPILWEPLHPSHVRSIEITEKYFDAFILEGQDILNHQKTFPLIKDIVKAIFGSRNEFKNLESEIDSILNNPRITSSKEKWDKLESALKNFENSNAATNKKYGEYQKYELCLKEIKLNFLFPRLDINVSKHINHLLKAPFCVHPKTGLISVPLDKNEIYNFALENIPNIFSCIEDHKNKKTSSLQKYLDYFERFANNLLN